MQSYPPSGGKWQVSTQGAINGHWNANGKEILYRDRSNSILAVPVSLSPTFQAGVPVKLFDRTVYGAGIARSRWIPTADCQRILLNVPEGSGSLQSFTVVQNWTAEVRRK